MKTNTCERCRFYDVFEHDKDVGICTRYPPRVIPRLDSGDYQEERKILFNSLMPRVYATTKCGEFQPVVAQA